MANQNQAEAKKITIRFPHELWRRLKMLEINGRIKSIHAVTLAAVEQEITTLEKEEKK